MGSPATAASEEFGFLQERPYKDPVRSFYSTLGFSAITGQDILQHELTPAAIYAAALVPFSSLSQSTSDDFVDPQILSMMTSSEQMLARCGDIMDGIEAKLDFASSGCIITHKDEGVQKRYRELAEELDLNAIVMDSWLVEEIYGNSYTAFADDGTTPLVFPFSPKRIAVGSQYGIGLRPILFAPGSSSVDSIRNQFSKQNLVSTAWNEWPELGDNVAGSAFLLDPTRIYHRHAQKPMFKRYGEPPAIGAWDALTDRVVLGEMIRSTIEGIKTQIRLWTIKDPRNKEIENLMGKINGVRTDRVYDLFWREGVNVVQLVPGTVSELLADETWMRLTARCFRDMGLSLTMSTGERMGGDSVGSSGDVDVQVQVGISRLEADLQRNIKLVKWVFKQYATRIEPDLLDKEAPGVAYHQSLLSERQRMEGIVPLLQYGAMSIRTAQERSGIDTDIEFARLKEEFPLRGKVIAPYAAFAQTANGNTTESPASPGRPSGPDLDPNNAKQNSKNAQNGSGK